MKLARFTDGYDKETYVNADRVNYVQDYGDGITIIHFSDAKDNITVKMPVGAVASTLFNAGKP